MVRCLRMVAVFCWLLASMSGCGDSEAGVDPQVVAAHRAKYLLESEPPDALGVLDLIETIRGTQEVVVIGKIGGVPEPWAKGRAAFIMADPSLLLENEGDGEHTEDCDCPFCSKNKDGASGLARVTFVDQDGQVVPVDARELFGVKDRQTVVVRGEATVDGLGELVVLAKGLYIRR